MYTAKKAWQLPIPKGCTHRLVLQDDGELCDNFVDIAEKVAKSNPNCIVSFFHENDIQHNNRYHSMIFTVGVALMIPTRFLPSLWETLDIRTSGTVAFFDEKVNKSITATIRLWRRFNDIPCITTVPTLVQHIGDESLVGIDRKRVATDFCKHPPIDGW